MNPKEITTMVCFHDLLGFGEMVSVSGGTFTSKVGEIAHQRISLLRQTVSDVSREFPTGTRLFQMNDSAIAVCDLELDINSMHVDAEHIACDIPKRETAVKALNFLGASAKLHHKTIQCEQNHTIGPAGRTFVVIGKRWPIPTLNDSIVDVPELQANLAFAEAHTADSMGSKHGFGNGVFDNFYVNDYMWFLLMGGVASWQDIMGNLAGLGNKDLPFPQNLRPVGSTPIVVNIFHRKRSFFSLMSHHAIDINTRLSSHG